MARTKKTGIRESLQQTLAFNQVSEIEIVYRTKTPTSQLPFIKCSADVYDLLRKQWDPLKMNLCEQFKVCLMNRGNKVLGICEISSGAIAGTMVETSFIIGLAILSNAKNLIISHNHPSGNLDPSKADLEITGKIKEACKLLDITLRDHIILTDNGYYSMADQGLL